MDMVKLKYVFVSFCHKEIDERQAKVNEMYDKAIAAKAGSKEYNEAILEAEKLKSECAGIRIVLDRIMTTEDE